jgi:hypothetical protein
MEVSIMLYGITFIDGGYRPAIAKEGRIWTQVVYNDGSTVKVKRTKEHLDFKPINNYTLPKLARRMLRSRNGLGCKKHVTKTARAILNTAKES